MGVGGGVGDGEGVSDGGGGAQMKKKIPLKNNWNKNLKSQNFEIFTQNEHLPAQRFYF